jgi:hypothetical protein
MYHSPQPTYDDEPVSSMLLVRHIQVLIDLGVEVTPESLYKLDFLLAKGVIPTKLMFGPSPPTMTFEEVERHNLLIRILINLGVEVTAESLYKLDLLLTNGIVPTKLMFN